MAIVKKVIGKVPIGRGNYSSTTAYYAENTVTMYGMSFRALTSISTGVAPAVADATGKVTLINTDKWQLMSGTPDGWNITAEVKDIKDRVIPEAVAEGIAEVVANAPEDLNTLKEVANYIASDKTNAAEIETAINNLQKADTQLTNSINANATNIAKNASDITANTEELANQAKKLETKAPKVGYAPELKVDFAKELVGRGVAEPQEIGAIRPTGLISIGDGNATIEKIKGKSVVWNQWYPSERLITPLGSGTVVTGNGVTTITTAEGSINGGTVATGFIPRNRNVLISVTHSGDSFELYMFNLFNAYLNASNVVTTTNIIRNIGGEDFIYSTFMFRNIKKESSTFYIYQIRIYDLTQMFGAGKEPSTVEEYEARKPLGVTNEYNEGEIISYDGANELKSVGFNAFNGTYAKVIGGQQYHALGSITSIGFTKELGGETTDVTLDSEGMFTPTETGYVYAEGSDIIIHLTHTYTPEHTTKYEEDTLQLPNIKAIKDKDGNQLFPYGMLSVGGTHDEITATKAVKRIGWVDMGTLEWSYNNQLHPSWGTFHTLIRAMKVGKWDAGLCSHYSLPKSEYDRSEDRVFTLTEYFGDKRLVVRDSRYTDGNTFIKAMQGVMFYYELEEPIEVDLPEPLNLTYDAWDFGTEELVAEGKTTPLNADIVYQFNAVDRIRENTAKNQALETELAELKAQLTQLTQVTNEQDSNA